MARRDPYRTLARNLENSLAGSVNRSKMLPLYLTRDEWALVIKALDSAAVPPAPRKKAVALTEPKEGDDAP